MLQLPCPPASHVLLLHASSNMAQGRQERCLASIDVSTQASIRLLSATCVCHPCAGGLGTNAFWQCPSQRFFFGVSQFPLLLPMLRSVLAWRGWCHEGAMIIRAGWAPRFHVLPVHARLEPDGERCSMLPALRSVLAWRKWFHRQGGGGPWAGAPSPAPDLAREQLLDRFHQHTQHCPSCSKVGPLLLAAQAGTAEDQLTGTSNTPHHRPEDCNSLPWAAAFCITFQSVGSCCMMRCIAARLDGQREVCRALPVAACWLCQCWTPVISHLLQLRFKLSTIAHSHFGGWPKLTVCSIPPSRCCSTPDTLPRPAQALGQLRAGRKLLLGVAGAALLAAAVALGRGVGPFSWAAGAPVLAALLVGVAEREAGALAGQVPVQRLRPHRARLSWRPAGA